MTEIDGADNRERAPAASLPRALSIAFGVMVSLALFLTLRLFIRTAPAPKAVSRAGAVRTGPLPSPVTTAPLVATPRSTPIGATSPPTGATSPPADAAAISAWVEGWRAAWQRGDLDSYIRNYASTFGSQGMDRGAWAEQKRAVFANGDEIAIGVSELKVSIRPTIAIVDFIQDYQRGDYSDRGRKLLYLVAEQGEWRIFNEEWTKLAPQPIAPPQPIATP